MKKAVLIMLLRDAEVRISSTPSLAQYSTSRLGSSDILRGRNCAPSFGIFENVFAVPSPFKGR
jgi:hypothetical protein